MKNIFILIRKLTISFGLLYTFNIITSRIGFCIPINLYTLGVVTAIDFPGILILIIIKNII